MRGRGVRRHGRGRGRVGRGGDARRLKRHEHVSIRGERFAENSIRDQVAENIRGAEAHIGLSIEYEQFFHPNAHVVEKPRLNTFVAHTYGR